ncbi:MAG: YIP1 family protein [Muribaculum sp.]|nr:YIP1 family protein [Muribaculum sp.]
MNGNEFDNYNLEEEEDDLTTDNNKEGRHSKSVFLLLLTTMVNPTEGWKKIRRMNPSVEKTGATCFYPVAALASLMAFFRFIYDPNADLKSVLTTAMIIFVSLFFGNFMALGIMKLILPRDTKNLPDNPFVKVMTMLMLTTLAMFIMLDYLLPMMEPVIVFMPLWTLYLISKAIRFLKVPSDKHATVTGIMAIAVIGAPCFVAWILSIITPSV